jgi:DNA-binding transcriptional MerR regulator
MTNDNKNVDLLFPIRELSAKTQVNTVTLRAWERRYGLLKPQRTSKGHRLYSTEDVATVEQIMELVARGVPLGKVKPLLQEGLSLTSKDEHSEYWQDAVVELIEAIDLFSIGKIEHLIRQAFASYPVRICREHLIEPVFFDLSQRDDNGAAFGFLESEVVRYTLMRLSAKKPEKKNAKTATLLAGNQTPIWGLALMALELSDVNLVVNLLNRPFTVFAVINLAENLSTTYTVYYQDGTWKDKEQMVMAEAFAKNNGLFLCGTAPALSPMSSEKRVLSDLDACTDSLLNQ